MRKFKLKKGKSLGRKAQKPCNLPTVASDGALVVSAGKHARTMVLTAVQQLGGQEFVTNWARENKTEFMTKLFPKIITREVEHEKKGSIEDIIEAAERLEQEKRTAIDTEFEEV